MGDARLSSEQQELYRISTYGENSNIPAKNDLAKGGFYFTHVGHKVKCAECGLEVDTSRIRLSEEVHALHKEKSPRCHFTASQSAPQSRTKKFVSYDSLRFEQERLETFIDWPVEWLSPADLARDGFYYLRTADHCACVFCRGIVGAWEKGDTPREEHRRHFPHCPFIKGQPVGNIPLAHSSIISRITPEASPTLPVSMDVCGSGRPMPGSYPESKPPKQADLVLASIGLPQHTGPKRKDFLSQTDRENSFTHWPEMVKQTPKALSEAGFFYCGLSDHVRCFHCGNGLRNWEKDDDPWQEHARWYPECNYVVLKKGQEFIDKVRREKPPYLRSQPAKKASSAAKALTSITEQELDPLMELDIIKATLAMGFPADKVRAALRRKLEQTGLPFFRLETCIEAVLQYMEEETRLALQQSSTRNVEAEAAAQQGAKMEALQSTTPTTTAATASTSSLSSSSSSSLSSSSAGPSSQPDPLASSSEEPMETSPISPTDDVLSQADQVIGLAEQALNAAPTSSSSPTPNPSSGTSLVTSATSTPTTPPAAATLVHPNLASSATSASSSSSQSHDDMKKPMDKLSLSGKPQNSQELAAELEKIKDSRMCKVCMDAEMDMVFLPCSHMVTCSSCALALTQCPICRNDIKYAIKPILS